MLPLDEKIRVRKTAYLDGRAGGQRHPESLVSNVGVPEEFINVRDVTGGLHEILQPNACRFQSGLQIFAYLLDLGAHVAAADDLPVPVTRQLAGNINLAARGADNDVSVRV